MRRSLDLHEILFPSHCLGCRTLNKGLCARCVLEWKMKNIESLVDGIRVFSSLRYTSVASHVLLAAKEDGIREGDVLLIEALRNSLRNFERAMLSGSVLVPIPSTARANRKRGRSFMYDLSTRLAMAESMAVWDLLEHSRKVVDQTKLNSQQREKNLAGAMRITGLPKMGRGIILVDDLVTTGASLSEAVRTLKASGTPVMGAITAFLAHPIR